MGEKGYPYALFKGKMISLSDAKLSVMTNALQYGTAIFGGIRGYISENKKNLFIFRLDDHINRFKDSLKILGQSLPYEYNQIKNNLIELVQKNKPDADCYIRPMAYASDLGISPDLHKVKFDFTAYMIPLGEYLSINKGLNLIFSSWIRIADEMIPARAKVSGAYINSSLAKAESSRLGYDDCLLLNSKGKLSEASAANVFLVKNGILYTPDSSSDILEGITRKSIIQFASQMGIKVAEKQIDKTEIYRADEVFLSGTGVQVAWVKSIDGRIISSQIGQITEKIQNKFFSIVRGDDKKYYHWLTKVYK